MISAYTLFPIIYLISLIVLGIALYFGIKKKNKILFFVAFIIIILGIVNFEFIIHSTTLSYDWYINGEGVPPNYCDPVPCVISY